VKGSNTVPSSVTNKYYCFKCYKPFSDIREHVREHYQKREHLMFDFKGAIYYSKEKVHAN